jgi:hypothetical protein
MALVLSSLEDIIESDGEEKGKDRAVDEDNVLPVLGIAAMVRH